MASNDKELQVVFRDQKDHADGHEVGYSFTVHKKQSCEMKSFSLDFSTTCDAPTAWTFSFYYHKDPGSGKITCTVTLSRRDNGRDPVQVLALVTFLDGDGDVARFSESVCSGEMKGGEIKEGSISEEGMADLINIPLTVQISISLSDCHGL